MPEVDGSGASLTRDGTLKTRLVVDCRRSVMARPRSVSCRPGILLRSTSSGHWMVIRQRVALPRISDVAAEWKELRQTDEPIEVARKHVMVKAEGTTRHNLFCGRGVWTGQWATPMVAISGPLGSVGAGSRMGQAIFLFAVLILLKRILCYLSNTVSVVVVRL